MSPYCNTMSYVYVKSKSNRQLKKLFKMNNARPGKHSAVGHISKITVSRNMSSAQYHFAASI